MLYSYFLDNENKPISKWTHYFPIYERFFTRYINQSVNVWEIGVQNGGSLQMWKRFFGPFAKIVGIDIDSDCKMHEERQINVAIGNQSDTAFLQEVIEAYGVPDIVIDDGSHVMGDILTTFEFLYPKINKNGIYMVEDLHTAYWEQYDGGLKREGTFIERCKELIDFLNARHNELPTGFADMTYSMSFFDSVAVFEKMEWTAQPMALHGMPQELFTYLASHTPILVFGSGSRGQVVFDALTEKGIKCEGFIVSDGQRITDHRSGLPVYHLSDFAELRNENKEKYRSLGILVAVKGADEKGIIDNLKGLDFDFFNAYID